MAMPWERPTEQGNQGSAMPWEKPQEKAPAQVPALKMDTSFDSIAEATGEHPRAVAEKAVRAMNFSEMMGISPATAFQYHDQIHEQLQGLITKEDASVTSWRKEEGGRELPTKKGKLGAAKAGFDNSLIGMLKNQKAATPFESPAQLEKWIEGFTQMGLDLPAFLAGYAGAGGTPVTGTAGGFGLTAGLRQILIDRYEKGATKNFGEMMDRIKSAASETIKGQVVGASTGIAGKTPIGYKAMNELATMTTVGKLVEGEVPTAQDFVDNAAIFAAMHFGIKAYDKAKTSLPTIKSRMQDAYVNNNLSPGEASSEALKRQINEEIHKDPHEAINDIISGNKHPEPAPEPEKPVKARVELIPAIKSGEELTVGKSGQHHADIGAEGEHGFVKKGEDGEFLSREEAKEALKKDDPETYKIWRDTNGEGDAGRFDTESLNAAKEQSKQTGIKNAITDAERESRGADPIESPLRGMPGWEETKKSVDESITDPRLIAAKVADGSRIPTPEDMQAILYDKMRLSNEMDAVMGSIEAARDRGDDQTVADNRERLKSLESLYETNEEASKTNASAWGVMGNVMQQMVAEDYSLARSLRRASVASKTGEVHPDIRNKIEDLTRQLKEAQKRLEDFEEQKRKQEADDTVKEIKRRIDRQKGREARAEKREDLNKEFTSYLSKLNKELSSISANPMFNPEAVKLLGKLAENRIRAGITKIEDIVADIQDHLADKRFSARDIRDAISGYGKTISMSQEEVKVKLREAKRQGQLLSALEDAQAKMLPLRSGLQRDKVSKEVKELQKKVQEAMKASGLKAERPEKSWESKQETYKKRITGDIVDLERRLAEGDYTKTPRKPLELNKENMELRAEKERLKARIDEEIKKQEFANMSGLEKGIHYMNKWRRAVLLSSVTTLGKLTSAAMQRFGITPIEELVGGVLSKMPVVSKVAEKAPREGGGLNLSAEAKAFSQFIDKATMDDIRETINTGKGSLDYLYGKKAHLPPEALDFFGHLHGALKVLPKRAEFFRSLEHRTQWALDHNLDIEDPRVQSTLAADAYVDANRAILMNDNGLTNVYRAALGVLKQQGPGGKVGAGAMEFLMPIVKVPSNFALETGTYAFGAVKGTAEILYHIFFGNGLENLTMHQADNIMRSLKKGSIGLALLAIGYYANENIAGYYQPGDKKRPEGQGLNAMDMQVGGVKIPHWLMHSPPIEVLRMGATLRRVNDAYSMAGKDVGPAAGGVAATVGLAKQVPFFEEPGKIMGSLGNYDTAGLFIDDLIKSLIIPPDVQKLAVAMDPMETPRKPKDLVETLKTGIPGLREEVGTKRRRFGVKGHYGE